LENALRASLVISALGHLAVIGWASFNFSSVDPFEVEPIKALPVEFIEASELTRLKAGERKAKPSEEPAAAKKAESENAGKAEKAPKKEQVASLPPPPPPQPEPPKSAAPAVPPRPKEAEASPEKPEPEPVPAKKEETKKEEEKKEDKPLIAAKDVPTPAIRPRHQPRPAPKPEQKQDAKFDPDRIAALLNKAPEQSAAQSRQVAALDAGAGDPRGLDERMSISEIDALRRQIQRCWSPPVGVRGASDLAVRLRLALNADGTLSRPPEVLTSGSGLGFLAAADSAKRAVLRCQPYDLPAGKYEAWRDINVNFDPREMLGG
jgi:hypothetical protein